MKPGVLGTVSGDHTVDSISRFSFLSTISILCLKCKKFVDQDRLMGFALQIVTRRVIVIRDGGLQATRRRREREY